MCVYLSIYLSVNAFVLFWDFSDMNISPFDSSHKFLRLCSHFMYICFSLNFRLDYFHCSIFKCIDSFLTFIFLFISLSGFLKFLIFYFLVLNLFPFFTFYFCSENAYLSKVLNFIS